MNWHTVLSFFNSIPADIWSAAGQLLLSGIITSPLWLGLRKWLQLEIRKHAKLLNFLVGAFTSFIAAATIYIVSNDSYAPYLLAAAAPITFFISQPVYLLAVKPIARRVSIWFAGQVAQAAALNVEQDAQKSAAVPASGLPIGSTTNQ